MKLRNNILLLAIFTVLSLGGSLLASSHAYARLPGPDPITTTPNVPIAASYEDCKKTFFGLVPWYYYMDGEFSSSSAASTNGLCDVKCFNLFRQNKANACGQVNSDIPAVLLAIADDLLRIAGVVSLAFILVGAMQYTTSQGDPEKASGAQSTITNALLGLAISMVAVAFVSFIGNRLGG